MDEYGLCLFGYTHRDEKNLEKVKDVRSKKLKFVAEDSTNGFKLKNISSDYQESAFIRSASNVDSIITGNKCEKKLRKRSIDICRQLDTVKTVKKKKSTHEDSSKVDKYSTSLFNHRSDVINISGNIEVEPVYEPLFSAKTFESLGLLHPHLAFTWLVPGILIGGEKRKSEKARVRKGITVLIGTPGRLLDHTKRTKSLSLSNVQWLVLDEADKLLDLGYEEAIGSLLEVLKMEQQTERTIQTVLLSATLTPGVERLAGLALNSPVRLDASEEKTENLNNDEVSLHFVIPQTLDQKYVIVAAKLRLVLLTATINYHYKQEKTNKILIFMATQDMVNFYTELLSCATQMKNISFFKLHGNMTQIERTEVFRKFRSTVSGVLLCTDVAARGLDLPQTDVIVQYNSPPNPADYVHRVGRTARVGSSGESVLFLESSEMNFLHWLNEKRIKLEEQDMETYLEGLVDLNVDSKKNKKLNVGIEEAANSLQLKFENAILEDKELHKIGCQAYKSWIRFYASYPKESRTVFCFKQLHLGHYAKSFALRDPPSAIGGIGKPSDLKMKNKTAIKKKKKMDGRLKVETTNEKTVRLVTSEFESGIKFKRKKM
ncbi:ATP-dependent DNA helicase DDX31 isoform X3 [Rhodnius prolixus]|uniref:ATP-dependent DNA helicase DDX31 isoform X3 n=1 Tax=Rhodnius prolixus TaxID=13249 RepID=UPI003D18BC82